ncbi:hypothetical protein NESM_000878800 [Novymonas esmeraldas]|uniref:Uncharacterized protein n=1 Tax=Novymonas esmeraldas TaxID=1808958 RepID=A0AAW0F1Y5_9TRYP
MHECTVYSPCGRYVVRFASNTQQQQQQQLRLTVTRNTGRSCNSGEAAATAANAERCSTSAAGDPVAVAPPLTSSSALEPPPLTATLSDKDVVALTTSAGVRKTFSTFAQMLYDALIGRSASVRFYVETVAEMKERIQRDVQQQQHQQQPPPPTVPLSTEKLNHGCRVRRESDAAVPGRVCARVGDTVIELDDDVAAEVLEQHFLTLDYDVDFTRAIFPIPLLSAVGEGRGGGTTGEPTPPPAAAATRAPMPAASASAEQELRRAREVAARLEVENARLRRENDALVQLSRQKMHEMQRLCEDFQHQVQLSADAEWLRAKNKDLRVQLQEALESQQTILRTLERERAQRRLLSSSPATGGSGRRGENPYLRSLSRDADRGSRGAALRRPSVSSTASRGSGRRGGRPLRSPTPPPTGSRGSRALHTPSASATTRHRLSTRFDTPPSAATARHSAEVARQRSRSCSNGGSGGGGDSPAPHGRTGGRLDGGRKPPRRGSSGSSCGSAAYGSRASSAHSGTRRGPSWWANDARDHASPCGSATASSSRCSSAHHERLYHAATASSRMHQTPTAHHTSHSHSTAASRRAVFH